MAVRGNTGPTLVLRLYVVSGAPNSVAARANLSQILSRLHPSAYTLEIVDCIAEPRRALDDGIFVTPALVKLDPAPAQTIIGSLSDQGRVIASLGLAPDSPDISAGAAHAGRE